MSFSITKSTYDCQFLRFLNFGWAVHTKVSGYSTNIQWIYRNYFILRRIWWTLASCNNKHTDKSSAILAITLAMSQIICLWLSGWLKYAESWQSVIPTYIHLSNLGFVRKLQQLLNGSSTTRSIFIWLSAFMWTPIVDISFICYFLGDSVQTPGKCILLTIC